MKTLLPSSFLTVSLFCYSETPRYVINFILIFLNQLSRKRFFWLTVISKHSKNSSKQISEGATSALSLKTFHLVLNMCKFALIPQWCPWSYKSFAMRKTPGCTWQLTCCFDWLLPCYGLNPVTVFKSLLSRNVNSVMFSTSWSSSVMSSSSSWPRVLSAGLAILCLTLVGRPKNCR